MRFKRFSPFTNYLDYNHTTARQSEYVALPAGGKTQTGYPKMTERVQKKLGRMFVEYMHVSKKDYLGTLVTEISGVLLKCDFPRERLPEVYDFLERGRAEVRNQNKSGGKTK